MNNKKYKESDLAFEVSLEILEARFAKNYTQEDLAKKMGTKQPSIARLENASKLPSLSFLFKMARAFNTRLIPPKFEFLENIKKEEAFNSAMTKKIELNINKQGPWSELIQDNLSEQITFTTSVCTSENQRALLNA